MQTKEKQRKDLKDQVNHFHEQNEQFQCQLLNRDVHRGCNTVSWGRFDKYDHANSKIISNFCKKQLFPNYKFLHESWKEYKPTDKGSLYYKICLEIDLPNYVKQNPSEREYFWMSKTVPLINKKYCKIQANITAKIKERYLGNYALEFREIITITMEEGSKIFLALELCS